MSQMRDWQGHDPSKDLGAELLLASGRCQHCWTRLDLCMQHSSLCLHSHMAFSPVSACICVSVSSPLPIQKPAIAFKAHLIHYGLFLNCILIISAKSLFQVRALSEVPSGHEFWAGGHFNSILVPHLIRISLTARSIYYRTPINSLAQNMTPEKKNSSMDESVCSLLLIHSHHNTTDTTYS